MKKILKFLIPIQHRITLFNFAMSVKNNLKLFAFQLAPEKYFKLNNSEYPYFCKKYNTTFLNERAVEIPVVLEYINNYSGKRILEIGNVLNHYFKFKFEVVDKYEKQDGMINVDILDFDPIEKYDLIVSISTFEHIGYDENIRYGTTPDKSIQSESVLKAIKKTKSLLKPGGVFVFTIPLGFNMFLDSKLENNQLMLSESFFLKRVNKNNTWQQVEYKDVRGIKYGEPYICANGIMIGVFKNN